jgi:hypothetical protein
MGWKDSLKDQLDIQSNKFVLYVNFAPINQSLVVSSRPVIVKSLCFFKKDKLGRNILVVDNGSDIYWITSYLSNYKLHIKDKHDIRNGTVYSVGGKWDDGV